MPGTIPYEPGGRQDGTLPILRGPPIQKCEGERALLGAELPGCQGRNASLAGSSAMCGSQAIPGN